MYLKVLVCLFFGVLVCGIPCSLFSLVHVHVNIKQVSIKFNFEDKAIGAIHLIGRN